MSAKREAFQRWLGSTDYICLPEDLINHKKRGERRKFSQKERYTKI